MNFGYVALLRGLIALACLILLPNVSARAATFYVNPGDNLAQIIWDAADGDQILVNEGTYVAQATAYTPSDPVFHVIRNVTLKAQGRRENTILQVGAGRDQIVKVHPGSYSTTSGKSYRTSPDGATIEGFTLVGDQGGVLVRDYQGLNGSSVANVTLRDLHITVSTGAGTHGIELNNASNAVVAGCVVQSAYANGIYVYQGHDNLILDNRVQYTATQHGIAVQNSSGNQVVGNTVTGAAHAGVILLNATDNRVADNDLSGFGVDGVTLTDGSKFNMVTNNVIVSDGWAAGRSHGTGIWLNCNSNLNVVTGNSVSGNAENGLTIFAASNNLMEGNHTWSNFHGGVFFWDETEFCFDANYPGETPVYNYLHGNYVNNNPSNAQVNIRGGLNNQVAFNHLDGRDTLNGILAGPNTGGVMLQTTRGNTVAANTISHVNNGEYVYSDVSATTFFRNRHFGNNLRYATSPAQVSWDGGLVLGGNFWDSLTVTGNPSAGYPFTDFVIDSIGNRGGGNVDNYPYQSASFGLENTVVIEQPRAGQMVARGSRKSIRWQSGGCVYVDLSFVAGDGSSATIATNYPDVGFYSWDVTEDFSIGGGQLQIDCKDTNGSVSSGSAWSGAFSITDGTLTLRAPGPWHTVTAGDLLRVAWEQDGTTPVDVTLVFRDGHESLVASGVTNGFVDVTLSPDLAGRATVRVTAADGAGDDSDGPVLIRAAGSTQVLVPAAGDRLRPGQVTEIEWLSPPGSVNVDIDVWNGSVWQAVANAYPDRGRFRWLVPALSTESARLRVVFRTLSNASAGSTVESGAFTVSTDLVDGGVCAATVDSGGSLDLPILYYFGLPLSAQLSFSGIEDGQFVYEVAGYSLLGVGAEAFSGCRPPVLTAEMELAVPALFLDGVPVHATFGASQAGGALRFKLQNYGTGNLP